MLGGKESASTILGLTKFLAEIGVTDIYLSLGLPLFVRYRTEVRPAHEAVAHYLEQARSPGSRINLPEGIEEVIAYLKENDVSFARDYIGYIARNMWLLYKVDPSFITPLFSYRAMDLGMTLEQGYRARIHAFFSQFPHEIPSNEAAVADFLAKTSMNEEAWYAFASYIRFVIRIIPPIPNSIGELGLHPALEEQFLSQKGLYLVTGPTSSGKSTTLAYLVRRASARLPWHIVTLEDPIEYLIPSGPMAGTRGIVHQREKGRDFRSFPEAMMQALRESPDAIVVGEIRDVDTLNWSIFLAEAGFTVLATYHTASFPDTVHRIVNSFPEEQQGMVRARLARVLRATVSQRLVRAASGMRLVYEYVPVNEAIASSIEKREYDSYSTPYPWEASINALVSQGEIGKEEAITLRAMVGAGKASDARPPLSQGRIFGP